MNDNLQIKLRELDNTLASKIQQFKAQVSSLTHELQTKSRDIQLKESQIQSIKSLHKSDTDNLKSQYKKRLEQEQITNEKRRNMLEDQNAQSLKRIKMAQEDADKWRKKCYEV